MLTKELGRPTVFFIHDEIGGFEGEQRTHGVVDPRIHQSQIKVARLVDAGV
jgi:hypothetical protein